MSLFRGYSLRTRCSGGSCLPGFSLEAGASRALHSRAGVLERGLTRRKRVTHRESDEQLRLHTDGFPGRDVERRVGVVLQKVCRLTLDRKRTDSFRSLWEGSDEGARFVRVANDDYEKNRLVQCNEHDSSRKFAASTCCGHDQTRKNILSRTARSAG